MILLLVGSLYDLDLSHALYANALRELGYEVQIGDVNTLSLDRKNITADVATIKTKLDPFSAVDGTVARQPIGDVSLVWLLNQPHPRLAQDTWQLLWHLNLSLPFVNDVVGLLMLNNKNNLGLIVPPENLPATLGSSDSVILTDRYQSDPQCKWVVKPPNGGAGADVFILEPGSTNNLALIESATGNAVAGGAIVRGGISGLQGRYAILQEYVPHKSEKRVVVCGGTTTIQWGRQLAEHEHRGNVSHEATIGRAQVTAEERALVDEVGANLLRYGIRFAGLDVAYPMVFEANLVNPGGLVEPAQLGIPDPYMEPAIERILAAVPGFGITA